MPINPFNKPQPTPNVDPETGLKNTDSQLLKESNVTKPVTKSSDTVFSSLFENDEEDDALELARNSTDPNKQLSSYSSQTIEAELENERARLKKLYPMGGLKSSRFITTKILIDSDPQFFAQFDNYIAKAVPAVQQEISDKGFASIIGDSQQNPTDEELQDKAYRIVQGITTEYLNRNSSYRALDRAIIINLVCDEIIGFSRLDPLWRDETVDEILCNGPKDIQVEIKGKLYRVPGCKFRDKQHLQTLVERLYGSIGKTVSRTTPIVDGRLHDNSRMAVVHDSVAPMGPNFSIRRHKEDYIGPQQMVNWGTASPEMMTFLGNLLYKGCSILVIGGTSSGKTTALGALSGFFRPDHRVLVLEDSLELKLAPNKLIAAPMECLVPRPDQPNSGVTMRDLVKASLRQRPNAIVVGEVRDGSCYDLCQALNTGHYGMSTIHANNEADAIYRLMSLVSQGGLMGGDSTLPLIAASFDVIVRIERFPTDGSRKIVSISEVAPFPAKRDTGELYLPTKPIWKFIDEGLDDMKVLGHWEQVGSMSVERREFRRLNLERDLTWEELLELSGEKRKTQ